MKGALDNVWADEASSAALRKVADERAAATDHERIRMTITAPVDRIHRYWQRHGLAATLRFLLSRIVRRQQHLVFEMYLDKPTEPAQWIEGQRMLVVGPENIDSELSPPLRAFLGGEGAEENLRGVRKGDRLFVVASGDEFQHCGYVLFKTRQTILLDEPDNPPLIACCFTHPSARGQGLYARALREEMRYLRAQGHRRAIIETSPDNIASRRGIEAAGFRPYREVHVWIVVNWLVFQTVTEVSGKRRARLFAL